VRNLLSVITPAYNEEQNLRVLYERLCAVLGSVQMEWEWIVIDDHSSDRTFEVLSELGRRDARVRALRFSRNFGSHAAVTCGLRHSRGSCAVVIAGDLQDPPEVIPQLLEAWHSGTQVVWAVRALREGESRSTVKLAGLFYWVMRNVVGMRELSATGADFFLVDRRVIDTFREFDERNVNLFALLAWLGFRQRAIAYSKAARLHGESGWSLKKKIKLAVDSITAFSYFPVRVMSWTGMITAIAGFGYALFVIHLAITTEVPVEGWSSLMVAVMVIGGLQMLMLGILGEYLWRALDEARKRPRYTIEAATQDTSAAVESAPRIEQRS
jgi:glycosyltransferase involved in cell wall biosynthesis